MGPGLAPGIRAGFVPGAYIAGEIADRGPMERDEEDGLSPAELRARDARELERQRTWRDQAARALNALREEEGTRPVNAEALEPGSEEDRLVALLESMDGAEQRDEDGGLIASPGTLPTLRVLPHGISRKRLEQAIRNLQLPVVVARDADEADVAMTLRSEYRQKPPALRDAEDRGLPIYVLKANTIAQMQASLTSIFALEVDPREVALRETEEAIGVVMKRQEPVELAPQNAYLRRLQHQIAEGANLISRSRGREPYRRVRIYPDPARIEWR